MSKESKNNAAVEAVQDTEVKTVEQLTEENAALEKQLAELQEAFDMLVKDHAALKEIIVRQTAALYGFNG